MSLCVRLALVVVYVTGLHALNFVFEPPCDDRLIEPVSGDTPYIDRIGFWETKGGEKIYHFWFYPTDGATSTRIINVYTWQTDVGDENRLLSRRTFPDDYTITNMNDKFNEITKANFENRVKTCMPWQSISVPKPKKVVDPRVTVLSPSTAALESTSTLPLMVHLIEQFPLFQLVTDPDTTYSPQTNGVVECSSKLGEISFSIKACWSDSNEIVFLKPNYIFAFMQGESERKCQIAHSLGVTNAGSLSPAYTQTNLNYERHPAYIRKYNYCGYYKRTIVSDFFNWIGIADDTYRTKKIQFYDYNVVEVKTPCFDYVSKPCFDNVFSFSGSACRWVSESTARADTGGVTLEYLLQKAAPSDATSTMIYGNNEFTMDLTNLNIKVEVQPSNARSGNVGQKFNWDGTALRLTYQSRLYITEKNGYSCSGCQIDEMVPSGAEQCNLPRLCVKCNSWERVQIETELSTCIPPFKKRKCVACLAHQNRSVSDQYACVACPPLWPMRPVSTPVCAPCEHTQYFNKGTAEGCVYLKSVADGLSFQSSAFFSGASYDEYMTPDSEKPRVVQALYYRDLITSGNAWNSSTTAIRCESFEIPVANESVAGVFTRNIFGTRVQFRSCCGHREIIKSGNAQLRLLQCVPSVTPTAFVKPDLFVSLRDVWTYATARGYELKYERNHVLIKDMRSVAEVTLSAGSVDCHYEIRREGRTDDCTLCLGAQYTQDCGPTYNNELVVPAVTGSGSCVQCVQRCYDADSFFAVERLSCWSNGTQRVSASDATWYGSLQKIETLLLPYRNYWYKPAPCKACDKLLYVGDVPWIVTRCGNKVLFETWHATLERVVQNIKRPMPRLCCAIDNVDVTGTGFASDLNTRCVNFADTTPTTDPYTRDSAKTLMLSGTTPQCSTSIPDLETKVLPFCPPGWFFDKTQPGCVQVLTAWDTKCCSECSKCATDGMIKTSEYKTCPGSTIFDTQLAGCITTCAEKHYQVNDTCVACESCA